MPTIDASAPSQVRTRPFNIARIVRALSSGEALPSLQRCAAEIIGRQAEEITTLRRTLRHLEAWAGVHEPTDEEAA